MEESSLECSSDGEKIWPFGCLKPLYVLFLPIPSLGYDLRRRYQGMENYSNDTFLDSEESQNINSQPHLRGNT
jgi:hypothetical protein